MSTESTRHGLVGRVEDKKKPQQLCGVANSLLLQIHKKLYTGRAEFPQKQCTTLSVELIIPALWCKHLKEAALETG